MPESALPNDPVPEDEQPAQITMQQFLSEQRAVLQSELQQHRMTQEHSARMIEALLLRMNLIDDHLAELAQPVEPGQEVQS